MTSMTLWFSSIQHHGSKPHFMLTDSNSDTKHMAIGTLSNLSSRR